MPRTAGFAGLTALMVLLAGCAGVRPLAEPPMPVPSPTETLSHGTAGDGPPPFVIRYDRTRLNLAPAAWCWSTGLQGSCADGIDLDPPSVGSPDDVLVFVPASGMDTLTVSQVSGERYGCDSRTLEAQVEDLGEGWWRLIPQGPADDYVFDLFASGVDADHRSRGSMSASLRWTTTVDRPLPAPGASVGIVANHDGAPDSYGLELQVWNLTTTPTSAAARITVTAADGASLTFDAQPADGCAGAGRLFFDGPDAEALAASRLGGFPFAYHVELTLDGTTHAADARYTGDEDDIAVSLVFEPALP